MKRLYQYKNPQILRILLLGISSSIPFFLLLSTLSTRLIESNISKTVIGIMTFITLPYSLKFILAPIIDRTKVPFLYYWLGKRRSWLLISQIGVMVFLCLMGTVNPTTQIFQLIAYGGCVAVFSAIQDIMIEAYRIESLPRRLIGYGSGASSFGYRIGTLISGAMALYIAHYFNWMIAYMCMAITMLIGIAVTLSSPEPNDLEVEGNLAVIPDKEQGGFYSYASNISFSLQSTIQEIFSIRRLWLVFLFIFCFKIGDTVLHTITGPFLIELGFSKAQIASVDKTFGFSTMLIGSVVGGIIISNISLKFALIFSTNMMIASCILFVIQSTLGNNLYFLFATIGLENFACGVGQVGLISYLSYICYNSPNTAVKFALLSSFSSFSRLIISSSFCLLADQVIWVQFFSILAISCTIPLVIIKFVPLNRFAKKSDKSALEDNKTKITRN